MGSEWRVVTLGEACESIQTGPFGSQLHKSDYVEAGIPSIMPINIGDNRIITNGIARITEKDATRLAKYRVKKGDVVYSRRGDVERRSIIRSNEEGWLCGTGCLRVRFNKKLIVPDYASFQLGSPQCREWIVRHAVGATMPNLNTRILSALPIVLPPLPEQKAIAHILGSLDDKIELNRRMNETLETMAQALFKSWFVDFDPVIDNALAAGNPIPEELEERAEVRRQALADGTANREVARAFPAGFQFTDEMGWIPEGWDVKEFESIAQNVREPVDPRTLPEGTPYVGLEHIDRHVFSLTKWGHASDVDSQKSRFESSDFLFGKLRPYFHKVCQVPVEGVCSTDILVIRPKENIFSGFVGCQIFEPEFVEYANLRSTGTRMPRANWKDMAKYEIALPGAQLIEAFNDIIQPIRIKCKSAVEEILTLSKLRDTLLPKLISGELRVPDAAKLAEEALA